MIVSWKEARDIVFHYKPVYTFFFYQVHTFFMNRFSSIEQDGEVEIHIVKITETETGTFTRRQRDIQGNTKSKSESGISTDFNWQEGMKTTGILEANRAIF